MQYDARIKALKEEYKENQFYDFTKLAGICYEIIAYALKEQDLDAQAFGYLHLGEAYYRANSNELAQEYLNIACKISEEYDLKHYKVAAYNTLGCIAMSVDSDIDALSFFYDVIYSRIERPDLIVSAYSNIGTIYRRIGAPGYAIISYQKGVKYYNDSIKEYPEYINELADVLIILYYNLAECFIATRDKMNSSFYIIKLEELYNERVSFLDNNIILLKCKYYALLRDNKSFKKHIDSFFDKLVLDAYSKEIIDNLIELLPICLNNNLLIDADKIIEAIANYQKRFNTKPLSMTYYESCVRYYKLIDDKEALMVAYENYYQNQVIINQKDGLRKRQSIMQIEALQYQRKSLCDENKNLQVALKNADLDKLTQLANRHSMHKVFDELLPKAIKEQNYLGVILIDLDNFKQYNDYYGHLAGDEYLARFAKLLKEVCKGCVCVRYGGDEFLIICDNFNEDQMKRLIEDLRRRLNREKMAVSIGYYNHIPTEATTYNVLIENADFAMYTSKKQGKNQATSYHDLLIGD